MSRPQVDPARERSLLETLAKLERQRQDLRTQIRLFAMAAMREGVTWRAIGQALGVSGQAAWEMYHEQPPPDVSGPVSALL